MRLMSQIKPVSVPAQSFEDSAAIIMNELQGAFAALVESVPGSIRRAVDLERTLRLEKKLAWKIFRLSRSASLAEVSNVPSLTATAKLLEVARKAGVSDEIAERVTEAVESFEDLVEQFGGDRNGLISMASGVSHEKSDQYDLNVRKAAFRAMSHIWGVQSRMQVRTNMLIPPRMPGVIPHLGVLANIGLQQTRPGSPVTMSAWAKAGPTLNVDPNATLGIEELETNFNLLTEFCSQPLPKMLPKANFDGTTEFEMVLPSVGVSGASTIYMGHRLDLTVDPKQLGHALMVNVSVPSAETIIDVLIPVGWTNPSTARVSVYGRRQHPERAFEERKIDLLPQRETVAYLGVVENAPLIEGAPRHQEAVRRALKQHDALGLRFDAYRCRVQYPVMHTLISVRMDYTPSYLSTFLSRTT